VGFRIQRASIRVRRLNPKQFVWLISDVLLPIVVGSLVWAILREPTNALILALVSVTLFILVQLYLEQLRARVQPLTITKKLIENANAAWNSTSSSLFKRLLEDKLERMANEVGPITIYCKGDELDEKGKLIAKITRGGFATYRGDLEDQWNTKTEYFELYRKTASESHAKIKRMFICKRPNLLKSSLLKQISEDTAAQIETSIVIWEDVKEIDALKDFGIWDENVLCLVERQDGKALGCEFTTDETRLSIAKNWRAILEGYAKPPTEVLQQESQVRPTLSLLELKESAPMMEEWAEDCESTNSILGGDPCRWYHATWQYLRLLDMVSTPDWHEEFYRSSLTEVFERNSTARVLISGLADYGMMAHVDRAARTTGAQPKITVLDICRTPLRSCEYYAKRHALRIVPVHDNIFRTNLQNSSFDLIVTDAFLTRFNPADRRKIAMKWDDLLSTNGVVVTTARLGNKNQLGGRWAPSQAQVENFAMRAWDVATTRAWLLFEKLASEEIKSTAREYAQKITSYPIENKDEITQLFPGFSQHSIIERQTPGEFEPTVYLDIVVQKA